MKYAVYALLYSSSKAAPSKYNGGEYGPPCRKKYTAPELREPDLYAGEPLKYVSVPE
jgi:hypothetical protein